MANSKKYISLSRLSDFLDNLKNTFATLSHTHKVSDLTDYVVDTELSSTSTNPVQNKVVNAEFTAVNTAFDAVTSVLDTMGDALDALGATVDNHNHNDIYYTEDEVDEKFDNAINEAKEDASNKDIVVLSEAQKGIDNAIASAKTYTDTVASGKADSDHNHDSDYDAIGSASTALDSAKEYTNTKTANLASTSTVDTKISSHNTSTSAHNDIRVLISDLTTKLNNFLDVDDTTADQLSEVITLIENNRGTLESLTTSKVNVSDIIDNLTTNSTSKVLSAAQGVAIKTLIDALQSELDSHSHAIEDVSGLQSALDGKADAEHTHTAMAFKSVDILYPDACNSVTYGNDMFVGVCSSDKALYSTDGITWNTTSMPSNKTWKSVAYGNGVFVAVPFGHYKAAYSTDGISWSEMKILSGSQNWNSVTYGNGKFVAVASYYNTDYSVTAYSTDGINWIQSNASPPCLWGSVTYGGGKFVAVPYSRNGSSSNTTAIYSTDGITWNTTSMPSSAEWGSIAYGNGMFVASGYIRTNGYGKIAYSTDGITWNSVTTVNELIHFRHVAYGNNMFVAIASDTIAYSTDGITWNTSAMPSDGWNYITYGGGKFVASGSLYNGSSYDYKKAYSVDGVNWVINKSCYIEQDEKQITIPVNSVDGAASVDVVNAHIADKNNPHGVTPAQIGAATAEQIAEKQLATKAFYFNGQTGSFRLSFNTSSNKRIPLRVTIGCQSGKVSTLEFMVNSTDGAPIQPICDIRGSALVTNVMYEAADGYTTYSITTNSGGWAFAYVECQSHYFDGSYKDLAANIVGTLDHLTEGTAMSLEYENPPMLAGVEYRTTERYQGNPVYTVVMQFGTIVEGENCAYHGIGDMLQPLRCSMVCDNGTTNSNSWAGTNVDIDSMFGITCNFDKREMRICSSITDGVDSIYYIQLWYTKTS